MGRLVAWPLIVEAVNYVLDRSVLIFFFVNNVKRGLGGDERWENLERGKKNIHLFYHVDWTSPFLFIIINSMAGKSCAHGPEHKWKVQRFASSHVAVVLVDQVLRSKTSSVVFAEWLGQRT